MDDWAETIFAGVKLARDIAIFAASMAAFGWLIFYGPDLARAAKTIADAPQLVAAAGVFQ